MIEGEKIVIKDWWDKDCDLAIEERKKKFNKFKRSGNLQDFIEYKKCCAQLKKINGKKRMGFYNFIESINKNMGMAYV